MKLNLSLTLLIHLHCGICRTLVPNSLPLRPDDQMSMKLERKRSKKDEELATADMAALMAMLAVA